MTDEYELPPNGWIDIHSHLLPGIDDGCRNLNESLDCIQRLLKKGFVGTVCTPHYWPSQFPQNTKPKIAAAVASLEEQLAARGMPYHLWAGAEVRIDDRTVHEFRTHGVPTLGPSQCVLVDFWGLQWEPYADETLDYLLAEGYQPILAHPERMGLPGEELTTLVAALADRGVWLQGNFNCASGQEGPHAERWLQQWLAEDRYHILALDMHRPETLATRFQGVDLVQNLIGPDKLVSLLHDRPREVLAHRVQQTTE